MNFLDFSKRPPRHPPHTCWPSGGRPRRVIRSTHPSTGTTSDPLRARHPNRRLIGSRATATAIDSHPKQRALNRVVDDVVEKTPPGPILNFYNPQVGIKTDLFCQPGLDVRLRYRCSAAGNGDEHPVSRPRLIKYGLRCGAVKDP